MLMRFVLVLTVLFVLSSCTPSPRYTIETLIKKKPSEKVTTAEETSKSLKGKIFKGLASYYAKDFHGKRTANGEIFDMYGLTAAHKTLPFNTWLEVKNLSNGRTVIVRINDRGPFVKGRIIDLSYGAAREIHMVETGVQNVEHLRILRIGVDPGVVPGPLPEPPIIVDETP